MTTLYTDEIINIIKNEYPNTDNEELTKMLGISESALRTKASRLGVKKSDEYMKKVYNKMNEYRSIKQESSYKNYKMTNIERNIIVGSLIGDGTLSMYGRSKNAHYRESTGPGQREYRLWKVKILKNLDFKTKKDGSIYSPSHPMYTDLYNLFYPNGKKTLSKEALSLLNHPIGLACLYMDDGSLVINNYKRNDDITLFPQILIYSQSFTKDENTLLRNYIQDTFGIEFKLSKRNDGSGYFLKINKTNEVYSFINIVKPYVEQIPSMKYKIDVDKKLSETKIRFVKKYKNRNIKLANKVAKDISYSIDEENKIIELFNKGYSYKDIASCLNRSYYGIYDKIRRMKADGRLD